ncbi:hypothetical protein F8W75_20510 [Salmonella enterica]|nr:hypothetical protein [Salmonella enterica]
MTPFPAACGLFTASGNGSMPTVEYRSRCLFDGENMPRKRLEGRVLKGECRAHNSNSAWQEQKNRPSRVRPDAGY